METRHELIRLSLRHERAVNAVTGLVAEMVLAFSVRRNVLTICDRCVGSDTIPTIHGLRSISMGWVILGHTCLVAFKYSGWRQ
jgi:hypothetical protein